MEEAHEPSTGRQEGETSQRTSKSNLERAAEDANNFLQLPAVALFYALPYMGLWELLSMEQVCRASREWVRDGVLLWRRLYVKQPLSSSLTDEVLCQLAKRSNGQLECLCLIDCLRITEKAVEQVVLTSPRLTKLFLPGCSRLTADGVVNIVKAHTDLWGATMPCLKELKLRNIRGLTEHHLQGLLKIMGKSAASHPVSKRRFFNEDDHQQFCDNNQRPIDVEVCPKCRDVRIVYDCSRKECQDKQQCRACVFCTMRCAECGICLRDDEFNETACFDFMCLNCWLKRPKCSECNRPACGRHLGNAFKVQQLTRLCWQCQELLLTPYDPEYDV